MKNLVLLQLFISLFLTSNSQTIDLIGFYNSHTDIAISLLPNYMILYTGDIIDISDPANPELISTYSCGYARSIIAEENYAYFGTGMSCDLHIADITNINFPLNLGYLDFGADIGYAVFGMAKNDSVLFVAMGASFCSIDITDKTNPTILDTLFITDGQSRDVRLHGSYAYVAHIMGLKVVDISDPENMQLINSIGSGYISIDISQTSAYLGKGFMTGGVDVFDITDPANPLPIFSKPNSGGASNDIEVKDNHIYLASDVGGLFIYKLVDNSAEEMANFTISGGQYFSVCLHDSLILFPESVTGVAILQYDSTGTVGIKNKMYMDNNFTVFPNPAKNFIQLKNKQPYQSPGEIHVAIFSIEGKLIDNFTFTDTLKKHDISHYKHGIYICKITDNSEVDELLKFIVY